MRARRIAAGVLVAGAIFLAWTAVTADTIRMKSGREYNGTAEELGDKVRITLDDGTRFQVNKDEVLEIVKGKTVLQQYAEKEAAVKPNDAEGRFQLALWCDRVDLKNEAVRECAKVLALQPEHRGGRDLMLRLLGGAPKVTPIDTTKPLTVVTTRETAQKLLLEERPATQDYFRRVVQPILNRDCASAQCHGGPAGGRLQFKRMTLGALPGPEVYLPNFDALYPYITDFDNPEKCPLLQHPLAVKEGGIPSKCRKVYASQNDQGFQTFARLIKMLLYPHGYKSSGREGKEARPGGAVRPE